MDENPPVVQAGRPKAPSLSHQKAVESPVYRMSELMFGSLLAAYVLGFIGFAASEATVAVNNGDLRILYPNGLTFLFISTTYAYLTAGLYVSYHVSVLTMPHLPFSNLRWDFLVALLQAVFFGISMLSPLWFTFCTGLVLAIAFGRQLLEHRLLSFALSIRLLPGKVPSDWTDLRSATEAQRELLVNFNREFRSVLRKFRRLEIWRPVPISSIGAGVLILAGLALVFGKWWYSDRPGAGVVMHHLVPAVSGVVFLAVAFFVNRVLKRRAGFIYNEKQMEALDTDFEKFYDELKERVQRVEQS